MHATLEERTLRYWRLSRKWNGHTPKAPKVKVAVALKQLKDIAGVTHHTKALKCLSSDLAEQMIMGGQSKKPADTAQSVGQLESNRT